MGTAIDLCTGAGAVAKTLSMGRSGARVVASEIDERAVACATANGVEVYQGDLFAPLPAAIEGDVDVVVGIVLYVPTPALEQLPRDTLVFETDRPYDGGVDGTDILRQVLADSPRFLKPGGALLLELGGDQVALLGQDLERFGFVEVVVLADDHGDARGIEATWSDRH
jgi:release factor glutamine methyltransferase